MNRKQLMVIWLLAAWLGFAFFWSARHVEEAGLWDRTKAKVSGAEPPPPTVTYEFVWERDGGKLLLIAVPAMLFGVPLVLALRDRK
jgi:hypothetical protein